MAGSEALARSLLWKRRLGFGGRLLPKTESRRAVLIYHSVGGGPLSLPVEQFREQLDWLEKHSRVVSLDDLLDDQSSADALQVALTFDDGYRTVFSVVAPLLAERNWPATVYLSSGHIKDECRHSSQPQVGHYPGEEFLLWDEVIQLSQLGWIIGSHGVEHIDLTKTDPIEVKRQLFDSKSDIESHLRQQCRHFAYTWGNCDQALTQKVEAAGYSYAAGAIHGAITPRIDALSFPRIDVRKEYALSDFVSVVRGDWDYLGLFQRIRRLIR